MPRSSSQVRAGYLSLVTNRKVSICDLRHTIVGMALEGERRRPHMTEQASIPVIVDGLDITACVAKIEDKAMQWFLSSLPPKRFQPFGTRL